ncbi:unnamed protein product [Symbiodinium natans]|uniref:Uncharacterized protein n=2 Tax=Symbiodinium natans TaxID=878477 RepID=A0A812PPH2_9DINO|nr:unnamed protein product [Symbiodinium natans]
MPTNKKPAAAAAVLKKPSAKTKEAQTKEEVLENMDADEGEHGEEEERTGDPVVDPQEKLAKAVTKYPFTLKNVKKHTDLMEARGWSATELHEAFRKLKPSEQQALWKLFERDRKANKVDEDFKKLTNGSGATNKKHEFLRGWLSDGCSVGPSFRKAQLAFEALDRHKTEVQWISWKQVCKKFGKKEALQRLENGSLKYRRNFLEFRHVQESFSHEHVKKRKTQVETEGGKVDKKLLHDMEGLKIEDVTAEDFEMQTALESMEVDEDVKNLILTKIGATEGSSGASSSSSSSEKKKKKKLKVKILKKASKDSSTRSSEKDWEKTSQLGDADGKPEFKSKIDSFLQEIQKDTDFFKALNLEKADADEKTFVKKTQTSLEGALQTLQKARKTLKLEEVKEALVAGLNALKKSKTAKAMDCCKDKKRKSKD